MVKNPYPGDVAWLDLADAARSNAARLLGCARMLLAGGSYGPSYAMGVLGLEELGKYMLCLEAAAGIAEPQQIWRSLNDHRTKLERASATIALFVADFIPEDAVRKMESLLPVSRRLRCAVCTSTGT